ncbi:MAG: TlpA disulfide reductase family protein [Steroidobacteraceae bacterium]
MRGSHLSCRNGMRGAVRHSTRERARTTHDAARPTTDRRTTTPTVAPGRAPRRAAAAGVALALALLAAWLPPPLRAATPGEVPVGGVLRDAPLLGLNGPSRRLAEFRGQRLIINVWASWCGPCRRETASLERLAWMDEARGITIIGVSTDDYPEKAKAWLRDSNATIGQYIDRNLVLENLLGAARIPLTVLVGADGRVLRKVYGARDWDSPESIALIRSTFAMAPPAPAALSARPPPPPASPPRPAAP